MALVDWTIIVVMVLAVIGGLTQGFFRSVFSLVGLVLGLALAAWNYRLVATMVYSFIHIEAVANTIGFLLIAFIVMGLFMVAGKILSKMFHKMGLGCLDNLAGAAFGLIQGALLVTLGVLVALAFYPNARWLSEAKLPRYFFGACHLSTRLSPSELADRIREGLRDLEDETPEWLRPGKIGV